MQLGIARNILVVEDEPLIAKDLQLSLQRLGYRVSDPATSADQAYESTKRCKPDLVLMDIHLDGPVDGIEAANVFGSLHNIPVVFLTAHADPETARRATRVGPYGYIFKPVRAEELHLVVELALHKHEFERRLHERERWFSTTLRAIADAVISVDTDCKVTFMNSAAEFMTGVQAADGMGCHVREVLRLLPLDSTCSDTDVAMETPLERALRERQTVDLPEARLLNLSNGEELIVSDSAAQVISDGQLLGAVMVFRDVTEHKQLEDTLRISDRMATMGLLAAGLAHEINNPLTVVMGNTRAIIANITDPSRNNTQPLVESEMLEMLEDSLAGANRIRDIIADVSLFSRSESPQQHNVIVQDVMEATLRMAGNVLRQRAKLETHYEPVPMVFASESQLGQVFLNLVINGVQAIQEGHAERNRIGVALTTDSEGAVVIEISDTGSGMSDATYKRLFSPFFTTKPIGVGTGLGLSICRRIVTSFGGTIWVKSKLGQGTTVRVVLPASTVATEPELVTRSWRPVPRARVMVIDDEPMVARAVERMLTPYHDVTVFGSAHQALEWINAGKYYEIILCDLMMPELNGMEFYTRLTSDFRDLATRVVIVSGGGFTPHVQAFLTRTGIPALNKPVALDTLLALISTYSPYVEANARSMSGE